MHTPPTWRLGPRPKPNRKRIVSMNDVAGTQLVMTDKEMVVRNEGGQIMVKIGYLGPGGNSEQPDPLTPEEKVYGRGLCLLPSGWENLTPENGENWASLVSDELRALWPQLAREQKMAVAHSLGEAYDEICNRSYAW
jgi:hypothetical protein